MSYKLTIIMFLTISSFISSCGDNALKGIYPSNPAEDAVKQLEAKNPDAAIEILVDALGTNIKLLYSAVSSIAADGSYTYTPTEFSDQLRPLINELIAKGTKHVPAMISVLSAAHGQKFGIDPFDIALSLATGNADAGNPSNSTITSLYPVLPEPTDENKRGLNEAIAILNALDIQYYTNADYFKQSLLFVSNISLITKSLDVAPEDGEISANEVLTLDVRDATELLQLVELAYQASLNSGENDGDESAGSRSASAISDLKSDLDQSEGESDNERAQDFITTITNAQ
ncbi:MAG: hypothetical protein HRU09_11875 [Oligoflexales bacterium]|nr:hypothetical protein [Oligoflexales bacterium]